MLRITRLTDYAIVVLSHLAGQQSGPCTSRGAARATGLPQPSVSKILKSLAKAGVVRSERGVQGGYRLAREPGSICVADIIDAVEGPISLTECTTERPDGCEYSGVCALESTWARINHAVRRALAEISLADIAMPPTPRLIQLGRGPRQSS
ncbi:MAG: SUF system Fe-S cluster assembly regulator [Polyangiaceae bacterium]|nr:SUF system Fe-S cluster assembly regulator [Polyangiaceae bacterium]